MNQDDVRADDILLLANLELFQRDSTQTLFAVPLPPDNLRLNAQRI
jgi:hypothetical protein